MPGEPERGLRIAPRGMTVLFGCALAAVILEALLFGFATDSMEQTTQGIIAARAQLDQFYDAKDLLVDAETGVRGYLLTGRPEYLEPYTAATARADSLLGAIAAMREDPAAKGQAPTEDFSRVARAKLDDLARIVETYRGGDRDRAIEMLATGFEKQAMDQVRALVQARRTELEQRVDSARIQRERILGWARSANIAAAVIVGGALVFLGIGLARHLVQQRALERRSANSNVELQEMLAQRTAELEGSLQRTHAELAERQHSERMLRESEERFRALVASVKDYAIYMLDPHGHVTSWNEGAQRIKGYSAEEILGKHFSVFYTEEDRNAGVPQTVLQSALEQGKHEVEAERVRKDGSRFYASVVVDPLRDPSGRLVGFAKITRDVTERRQQQAALDETRAALAQAQKMDALGKLSGGIAHDFNNLLHVIRNAAEVLARRLPGLDGQQSDALDMIKRNADRAANLTRRLLAFARRQPLEPQTVDPGRLVQGMGGMLKASLGEAVDLQIVVGAGNWPISADPGQLEAAIVNLAVNARDAMPNGGRLTIETSNAYLDEGYAAANAEVDPGQYALISVSDTGAGMPRETMTRAFEPFFTTKEAGRGTGLGLSQVYGFIKQSGGHIKIYSELAQGTTVKLYLPRLWTAAASEQREPLPPPPPTAAATETVLVVEDDEDVLLSTATVLRELGYRVLAAPDAQTALAALDEDRHVDLLFVDVGLPGMNGRQLADEALRRWPALKVLFTTAYARNAIFHHGRLDPGVELIVKPFTQSALADKIRKTLDSA